MDDLTFEEAVAQIQSTLNSTPRYSEIEYRILEYCKTRRTLVEVEDMVLGLPQFPACDQNPYRLIFFMEDCGGLQRFELDAEGNVVDEEAKEGLSEDEIDDLVWDYAFETTEAGKQAADEMKPEKRMDKLFKLFPQRISTYCDVLEFCKEPRGWKEIDALLQGRDVLKSGSLNWQTNLPLQPTVFIDRLEAAGGLVWDNGWKITEEGRKFLELIETVDK